MEEQPSNRIVAAKKGSSVQAKLQREWRIKGSVNLIRDRVHESAGKWTPREQEIRLAFANGILFKRDIAGR
jgi:hypothetical protein